MNVIGRAAMIGAASGLRSQFGSGAVVLALRNQNAPAFLRRRTVQTAFALAAVGEIVADKLPVAGSRLAPGPLAARVVLGGAAAGYLAWSREASVVPAVAVAVLGALGAAKLGHDLRVAVAKKVPDLAVAIGEDALAASLALAAVR